MNSRLLPAFLWCLLAGAVQADMTSLNVLTFNVKVDFDRDETAPDWEQRKEASADMLRASQADLIALQECSPAQLAHFAQALEGYSHVGALPFESDDPKSPLTLLKNMGISAYTDAILFYRSTDFEVLDHGHWWLSPTPEKISNGFGNILPRVLMWVKLRHRASGGTLALGVTHFDNTSPAQTKMAPVAHKKLQEFVTEGLPVIFLGDFNTDQTRGDYPLLTSNGWCDSYLASPQASVDGHDDNVSTSTGRGRIDHIFYHGSGLTPRAWEVLHQPEGAAPISDHYPVRAEFEWRPAP